MKRPAKIYQDNVKATLCYWIVLYLILSDLPSPRYGKIGGLGFKFVRGGSDYQLKTFSCGLA